MQKGKNKVQYKGKLKVEDSVMDTPKYKRVLLKISGEALAGDKKFGLDFNVMGQVADVIRECVQMGV